MNFLDLFAGIGGFRLGMERAGHKCVGYCEIDKYARLSYNAIHNTEGEIDYKDITEVTNEEFRKLRGKVDVICGGFPCQAFQLLETNWDLRMLEELYSMKLLERLNKSNHAICSLKTCETFYHTTREKRSRECLKSWMNWGMMQNGKCLTARISECHKTENEYSLSDILEENVPTEYFLSLEELQGLVTKVQ